MTTVLRKIDKPLLIMTLILFAIGLIMVFSSSNVTAYMLKDASPYTYLIKQSIFLGVGFTFAFFMIRMKTTTYGKFSYLLMIVLLGAQLLLPFFGVLRNNSRSWYALGPLTFQPSEFMKVVSIFFLAFYYDVNRKKLNKYVKVFFPIAICLFSAGLMFMEPDLGTMIIYGSIVAAIFFAQPISWNIKIKTIVLGGAAVVIAALIYTGTGHDLLIGRQKDRLGKDNPCDNLLTTGNQICNGYIAINNGGLTGVGLGNSTQKYLYLPEPYTDFIFCIIIEELGLVTGLFIIAMYFFILVRILVIGRASSTNTGATICYGVAFYIFVHIAVNLLGLFGVIPMTGVPLPFMSYGGSFTLCLITALTAVQRVQIENRLGVD